MTKENFNTSLLIFLIILYGCNIFPLRAVVTFREVPAIDYIGKEIANARMYQTSVSYGINLFNTNFEIGRPTQISYFTVPK